MYSHTQGRSYVDQMDTDSAGEGVWSPQESDRKVKVTKTKNEQMEALYSCTEFLYNTMPMYLISSIQIDAIPRSNKEIARRKFSNIWPDTPWKGTLDLIVGENTYPLIVSSLGTFL